MTSMGDRAFDNDADQTAPGLHMLKEIWHITDKPVRHEAPTEKVSTDIYNVPATSRRVPQRVHPPR